MAATRLPIVQRPGTPDLDLDALARVARLLNAAARPLARRRGVPRYGEVALMFVGKRESSRIHAAVCGVRGSTDVITIPYGAFPGELPKAELVICPEVAVDAALNRNNQPLIPEEKGLSWGADEELALYIAHGFDHLALSEDLDDRSWRKMRLRELGWLSKLPQPLRLFRKVGLNA